jgi:AcrR family transcriptional regulator
MPPSRRKARVDGQQNRERLLEAALRLFAAHGAGVAPTAVATEAGVGVGTLYRHFASREALIEAAYRADLDRLCDSVTDLLAEHFGAPALRMWLDRCVDHAIVKRGMADALRAITSGADPYTHSRERLTSAVAALLTAGAADGTLRPDLDPYDVLVAVTGVSLATGEYGNRDQAGRLLDLMMDSFTRSTRPG